MTLRDENDDAPPAGFVPFDSRGSAERLVGPYYCLIDSDTRTMGFRVQPRHLNHNGVCHGGVISAFADSQSAVLKCETPLARWVTPTINLSVDFVAPALLGAWVQSTPVLLRATAKLMFVSADIRVDGEIVARASAIYRITRRTVGQD
jgi:uncharacterized protein (TIGR00369 family)